MAQYRKKPLLVDAVQYTGDNVKEVFEEFGKDGILVAREGHLILTTTHGDPAPCRAGDWVVPDSQPGTFYPIKPDVFAATYEPV